MIRFQKVLNKQHICDSGAWKQGGGNMARGQETDPRVIRTKQLIQDALLTLVQQKDFADITVKDISEKATINRATFYAHYVDKFVLLDEMISEGFDSCVDGRIPPGRELTETTGRELIRLINEYQIAFFEKWRMDTKTIAGRVENIIKSKLENIIASYIKNQSTGVDSTNADQQILTAMISGAIFSASLAFVKNGSMHDFDRFSGRVLAFVLSGMNTMLEGHGKKVSARENSEIR